MKWRLNRYSNVSAANKEPDQTLSENSVADSRDRNFLYGNKLVCLDR
jgi:hypothetical protein